MGPITWFLFVYVIGGLTFIPLLLALILLHAYLTFPLNTGAPEPVDDAADIKRSADDNFSLNSATDSLADQFQRKHESDVAAGYFAVCREYVPGGVNGKPPERNTPAGEVVATESPSVYQSMYRSIFDRQQRPTIEPNKAGGKLTKKANNVFFVVLRHGHLMLYDDAEQLDVRHVISLEYHNVSIYGGGEDIPEGELWMKKNSIRLERKPSYKGSRSSSLPFYLFSENQSEKEDFYFALLKNQEKIPGSDESPPLPREYNVKHIITLVQELHSSEEQLQTRWINALMGRLFLAMYKTPELEDLIRQKMTKKISRVKKPNFITRLAFNKIDLGEGAPFITNPRLKDLTVNGDCTVEVDVTYSGKFRIEIAATARIDLGARIKAREVELVLAAVIKKAEGHLLIRIKPPPSNRIWVTFETMPKIDMNIEPIVSSRQITYNVVLRAIESRIREVVAETLVLPFWEDFAFLDTDGERFRGGIWKKAKVAQKPTLIPDEDPEDEAEAGGNSTDSSIDVLKTVEERTLSMPILPPPPLPSTLKIRKGHKSGKSITDAITTKSTTSLDKMTRGEPPRALRSSSFASAADPMLSPNHADADSMRLGDSEALNRSEVAAALLKDLSARSLSSSPVESLTGSPPNGTVTVSGIEKRGSDILSKASTESLSASNQPHHSTSSLVQVETPTPLTYSPTTASLEPRSSLDVDGETMSSRKSSYTPSIMSTDKRKSVSSLNSATSAAREWGWGVLNRNKQKPVSLEPNNIPGRPKSPMGRGLPLPPPGTPLPTPERLAKNIAPLLPKRKAVPPPPLPKRGDVIPVGEVSSSSKPPLPERRQRPSSTQANDEEADEMLVVEAPMESAPVTPIAEEHDEHHDDFFGHGEQHEDAEAEDNSASAHELEAAPEMEPEPEPELKPEPKQEEPKQEKPKPPPRPNQNAAPAKPVQEGKPPAYGGIEENPW